MSLLPALEEKLLRFSDTEAGSLEPAARQERHTQPHNHCLNLGYSKDTPAFCQFPAEYCTPTACRSGAGRLFLGIQRF
jgi:hypothetical protein